MAGGVAGILQPAEPRSLDPVNLSNTFSHQPVLGNALYGTLMVNNLDTLELEYKMATDFSTTDGGSTFTLVLQPGLTFTDETPFDAAAVKFNWDRLRDPALGGTAIRQAGQVSASEVVDPITLKITLRAPNPHFGQGLITNAMNWIASPTALQKGQQAFDANPVGAGPFTLVKWTRQDAIELERNPGYWDAPKPYLDRLTIRSTADTNQRFNALTTGMADLSSESSWSVLAKADASGFPTEVVPTGGGQFLGMNFRRAPFDDERARRAVVLATDLDAINAAVFGGEAAYPQTLFPQSSPYFVDVTLPTQDKQTAQKLFDELAAEGKPVTFTFLSYPSEESKAVAEALQAQLSAFAHVEAEVEVADFAAVTARAGARDFDMMISSAIVQDPDYALWTAFHGSSPGNFTGINDSELSAALDAGRVGTSVEERKTAYETVQKRLVALNPGLWYVLGAPSVISSKELHGIDLYTLGSPLPEELWITE
ncbi:ABC transporter substrate-binding protein [Rhodococcus sp. 24CO]|uniref:ABC transporter substrate-binding protein n=1 Tax=Rhodococcus sp. 24CO TaxID=3117460 RepID=UPI003D34DF39